MADQIRACRVRYPISGRVLDNPKGKTECEGRRTEKPEPLPGSFLTEICPPRLSMISAYGESSDQIAQPTDNQFNIGHSFSDIADEHSLGHHSPEPFLIMVIFELQIVGMREIARRVTTMVL